MAARVLALAVVAAVVLAWQCTAQTAPPGPGCMPELVSLSPCMDYMTGNETAPDGPCCSAVSGMLRSSPTCLCMVVGGTAASLGVAVDGARALGLPWACKVQAPPASQCNGKCPYPAWQDQNGWLRSALVKNVPRLCSQGSSNAFFSGGGDDHTGDSGSGGAVRRQQHPWRFSTRRSI